MNKKKIERNSSNTYMYMFIYVFNLSRRGWDQLSLV